jgi:glutathione synthase/RimK-type ligase-like ATP-grasp enzyme
MEYQFLLTLAERHGVLVIDPQAHPELAAKLSAQKKLTDESPPRLLASDSPPEGDSQET